MVGIFRGVLIFVIIMVDSAIMKIFTHEINVYSYVRIQVLRDCDGRGRPHGQLANIHLRSYNVASVIKQRYNENGSGASLSLLSTS